MAQALSPIRQDTTSGGFRVAAPRAADVITGTLRSAYCGQRDMPDDFANLLAMLDKVDSRPS